MRAAVEEDAALRRKLETRLYALRSFQFLRSKVDEWDGQESHHKARKSELAAVCEDIRLVCEKDKEYLVDPTPWAQHKLHKVLDSAVADTAFPLTAETGFGAAPVKMKAGTLRWPLKLRLPTPSRDVFQGGELAIPEAVRPEEIDLAHVIGAVTAEAVTGMKWDREYKKEKDGWIPALTRELKKELFDGELKSLGKSALLHYIELGHPGRPINVHNEMVDPMEVRFAVVKGDVTKYLPEKLHYKHEKGNVAIITLTLGCNKNEKHNWKIKVTEMPANDRTDLEACTTILALRRN